MLYDLAASQYRQMSHKYVTDHVCTVRLNCLTVQLCPGILHKHPIQSECLLLHIVDECRATVHTCTACTCQLLHCKTKPDFVTRLFRVGHVSYRPPKHRDDKKTAYILTARFSCLSVELESTAVQLCIIRSFFSSVRNTNVQ